MEQRNTVTAFLLIGLVLIGWYLWLRPQMTPAPASVPAPRDSLAAVEAPPAAPADSSFRPDTLAVDSTLGAAGQGTNRLVTVETDRYVAVLATQGASIRSFKLKDYTRPDRRTPVELVDSTEAQRGALGLSFLSKNNRKLDTRSLFFATPDTAGTIRVTADSVVVPFEANLGGGVLRLAYVFHKTSYEVGLRVERQNSAAFAAPDGYSLVWNGALPFSEETRYEEVLRSAVSARSGGELEHMTFASDSVHAPLRLSGEVTWTSIKNKYFTVAIFPGRTTEGATLIGQRHGDPKTNATLDFSQSLDLPALPDGQTDRFRLYMGPLTPTLVAAYPGDLFDSVDLGWDWLEVITRPFSKFILSPYFALAGGMLKNYGLVLILLALLIKLATHPMTKAQTRSMSKMRDLQPRIAAIKERYADDPQKQQQATMQLYKEMGVNPLGGCLPMLIQYPFLIALWQYIPQSIALRQEPFLWAKDLSAPDAILHLPFTIPLYGNFVAGFALLMTISMVVQMRLTMKNQPQNDQTRIMTTIMPIMLLVFFNQTSSGLSLYYLFYNIFSAAEQWWLRRSFPTTPANVGGVATDTPKASGPRSTPPKHKLGLQEGQNN
ncbi:MAG: membrane protein insertase YidC [Bacteroidetes bacterium]|nr:membrane protein insertase YidC [Bacteroidota bacterium]